MIQNIRVGIPVIGNKNWIGGITYIELLVKAISKLPQIERPQLHLIVPEDNLQALELHQSIFNLLDGFIFLGQDVTKAENSIPAPFIFCRNYQRLSEEVDFVFPVNSGIYPKVCSGSWIPDFQHVHLPEYFSAEELEKRDKAFKRVAEEARLAVFSSQDAENDFKKLFPDTQVITRVLRFSASFDPELFVKDPRDTQIKYNLPDNYLICPNQFWAHKNHGRLFQAIADLANRGQALHLVCTGSTNDYRSKEYFSQLTDQIEELGIKDLVHIVGFIPREDQIQLIRRSMAVVQPSLFEGWSTVTEDARALGKIIFLSDLAVHYEQAPEHAIYFDRYDFKSLAEVIHQNLSKLTAGPDIEKEAHALRSTDKRIMEFAKEFCSIVVESQFIFGKKIRGINDELWDLLSEKISGQEIGAAVENQRVLKTTKTNTQSQRDFSVSQQYPEDVSKKIQSALSLFSSGDKQHALEDFRQATNLLPDDPGLVCEFGKILCFVGEADEARREFIKAAAIAPDYPSPHICLASLTLLDSMSQVEDSLLTALQIEPQNQEALSLIAYLRPLKAAVNHSLQPKLFDSLLSGNPVDEVAQTPDEAPEDRLSVRKQIGYRLNLDAPISDEELDQTVQLLSEIISHPDGFLSSKDRLNDLTPAFFALLDVNIETAYADGNFTLAEELTKFHKNLSSMKENKLPSISEAKKENIRVPAINKNEKKSPSIIFFHIPKAGGTTFDSILERQFDPSEIFTLDRDSIEPSADEFKNMPSEERMKYRLLKGHMWFGLNLHEYMMQPSKYITMLREPIARVISHYYYAKRKKVHYLNQRINDENISLKEYFTKGLTGEVDNGQTRLLADLSISAPYGKCPPELLENAINNLQNHFAIFGLMERFDETLILMKRYFGWDSVFYEKKNVSSEKVNIEEIPADTMDVILEYNQLDIQLYQYVQNRLDELIRQQGGSFFEELAEFKSLNQDYHVEDSRA